MSTNELKENQSYSCTDCSSVIEILELDDANNTLFFKCPLHGQKEMAIKDYLNNMKKNTFLYSICSSCKKNQNEVNNNEIFNYCIQCKLVLCNNCKVNHDQKHNIIKNNQILTNCLLHPQNYNLSYCLDCNCHICKECIEHRKHMRHNIRAIKDNQPSNEELENLLNLINKYKDQINNSKLEKNNKLFEKETKFNEDMEKEKTEYKTSFINIKKNLQKELTENENNFNNKIAEIKKKYEKEINKQKKLCAENKKTINEEYEKKIIKKKKEYDTNLDELEKKYKEDKNDIENSFKKEINQINELLNLNTIIYNTYNKSKENYFHSINVINLLISYYKNGNKTIRVMKNNEDFLETIKQIEYESTINPNKSFVQEKKSFNKYNDIILPLPDDNYKPNTSPRNREKNKDFLANIDNNKDVQSNLNNNNNIVKNLNQNFNNDLDDKKIIQNKESNLNNYIMINNEIQNQFQNFDDNNNKIIQNKESNKKEISNSVNPIKNDIYYNNNFTNVGLNNNNNNNINNSIYKYIINKPKINNANLYQKNIKKSIKQSKNNSLSKKSFEEMNKNDK